MSEFGAQAQVAQYQQSSVRLKRGDSDGLVQDWTCKELDEGLRKRSI